MSNATNSQLCVFCHQPIGDEPAIEATAYDGIAHRRCFFTSTKSNRDEL